MLDQYFLVWIFRDKGLLSATLATGRGVICVHIKLNEIFTSTVWKREQMLLEWATAMYQPGVSFHTYGKLLKGNHAFQKSVAAFKNVIKSLRGAVSEGEIIVGHN